MLGVLIIDEGSDDLLEKWLTSQSRLKPYDGLYASIISYELAPYTV